MNRVDHALLFPGVCCLTRSGDGPFIDLVRQNQFGERIYVSEQIVLDMARAIGMWGAQEIAAVEGSVDELDELRSRHEALQDEYRAFQASVRHTLRRGGVERGGEVGLRPVPGQPAVDFKP